MFDGLNPLPHVYPSLCFHPQIRWVWKTTQGRLYLEHAPYRPSGWSDGALAFPGIGLLSLLLPTYMHILFISTRFLSAKWTSERRIAFHAGGKCTQTSVKYLRARPARQQSCLWSSGRLAALAKPIIMKKPRRNAVNPQRLRMFCMHRTSLMMCMVEQ